MANIHPDLSPKGQPQGAIVDFIYQILNSIETICEQLDADGTVNDTDYEANCYTDIFTVRVTDQKGNYLPPASSGEYNITPGGLDEGALIEFMYQVHDSLETLTEQLDADSGVTDTTYEALCYTAIMLHDVENKKGEKLGNGNNFIFRPGAGLNSKEFVEWAYNVINAIETLTEQLDADGTVTDTDYEANGFTATMLTKVENAAGNVLGN